MERATSGVELNAQYLAIVNPRPAAGAGKLVEPHSIGFRAASIGVDVIRPTIPVTPPDCAPGLRWWATPLYLRLAATAPSYETVNGPFSGC